MTSTRKTLGIASLINRIYKALREVGMRRRGLVAENVSGLNFKIKNGKTCEATLYFNLRPRKQKPDSLRVGITKRNKSTKKIVLREEVGKIDNIANASEEWLEETIRLALKAVKHCS